MSNSEHFHSNIDSQEYRINHSFNCDSSNVVYLLECTVCGVQNMLVAPARLLGLGLIIIRRAVVSLIWGPQFPRWNSSGIRMCILKSSCAICNKVNIDSQEKHIH